MHLYMLLSWPSKQSLKKITCISEKLSFMAGLMNLLGTVYIHSQAVNSTYLNICVTRKSVFRSNTDFIVILSNIRLLYLSLMKTFFYSVSCLVSWQHSGVVVSSAGSQQEDCSLKASWSLCSH